jgi:hypothetical protein
MPMERLPPLDRRMKPLLAALVCSLVLTGMAHADPPVDYLRDIKPLLAKHCYECHGATKQRSGLRLDTAAAILRGGDSGPGVIPGKSVDSKLIKAVTGVEGTKQMPPKEPRLDAKQIGLLRAWIDQGARAPRQEVAESASGGAKHWSFRAPARPPLPVVRNQAWVRTAIDRFILARLEKDGIEPSAEADRVTLIRRVSLDLTGLPPAPEEIDRFVADNRPDAYERLVDRLLASPHYGERWGRHWLDLARYADSNGYSIDAPRSIWKYRDWVIHALNRDLPFDQFVMEQLAGDLLPRAALDQKIATGFHRNTPINEEGGIDLEQFRIESVVDRVNTTGAVFLGLTLGCAQCHDHKYDPISQREYYQLFAFFNNCDEPVLEVPTAAQLQERRRLEAQIAVRRKRLETLDPTSDAKQAAWEKNLSHGEQAKLPAEIRAILYLPVYQRSAAQKKKLKEVYRNADRARHAVGGLGNPLPFASLAHVKLARTRTALEKDIARLERAQPQVVTTLVMREREIPRATHIHLGGDFLRNGAVVSPAVPAVLGPPLHSSQPNRIDLAQWLVSGENPLTARVTMNRFWQSYFGLALVETENDFGTQGTPPSHPELLDWLATEFVARKWSMKAMHRLLVTSATYRQASHSRPDLAGRDPRNRLLARQARLRLDAEVVRDVALTSSGLLSRRIGGPSVFPPQPSGIYSFTQVVRDWKEESGPERYRRGMYTAFWRSAAHPALLVFDAPNAVSACTRRVRSNTPLQALTLLNDRGFYEFARALALRILTEAGAGDRIRYAFRLCLGRNPAPIEEQRLRALLVKESADLEGTADGSKATGGDGTKGLDARELAAYTTLARVLLNLDEFITRE